MLQAPQDINPTKHQSYPTSVTIDAPPNKDIITTPHSPDQPNNQANSEVQDNKSGNFLGENPSHANDETRLPSNTHEGQTVVKVPEGEISQLNKSSYPIAKSGGGINEQEALNHLRKELEIERKEVDKWKKEQQQDIAEERRKIQEAQHGLLEEKIR